MHTEMDIFTEAYETHREELFHYSLGKTHDRALSHDLVQTTFMKTWMYLGKGNKISLLRAFLYNVLKNLIVDEYRKRKPVSLDLLVENGHEPTTFNEETMISAIDGKALFGLVKKLPVRYQEVVDLRYCKGLLTKEICLITGRSPNTVNVQIHRGIGKMRELLHSA